MFQSNRLHKDESGQTALETAIILIAFVVVASVFAFTILSAGQASTQKGEQAIYAGLQGVQSSMELKGAVVADGTPAVGAGTVDHVTFTLQLVSGGDPVDLTDNGGVTAAGGNKVVITYLDATHRVTDIAWTSTFVGNFTADKMLQAGELAQIKVTLTGLAVTKLGPRTPFTLEIKPPTGSVIQIQRTTPAAISAFMELR